MANSTNINTRNGAGNNGAALNGGTAGMNGSNGANGANGASGGARPQRFNQPVILRQSPRWAVAVVLGILSITTISVLAAFIAKVEQTVAAQGKLEPVGVVQPVQTPSGGVIDTIHVEEGQFVEEDEVLITFDQSAARAELTSLTQIRQQLATEVEFYRGQQSGAATGAAPTATSDLALRLQEKSALASSNRVYQAQINGNTGGLSGSQLDEVSSARGELAERQAQNESRIADLERQLSQADSELVNAQNDLRTNEEILQSFQNLEANGAVARLNRLQQEQEVHTRRTRINTLQDERGRLQEQISQARAEINRAGLEFEENRRSRIRSNNERIASIESDLGQAVLQNTSRLQEIDSRIAQLETQLSYQELKAPVPGVVFNLKANQPGYTANSTEPILEIVPQENLVARVFIPNQEIGFVLEENPDIGQSWEQCQAAADEDNMDAVRQFCKQVDVRIDAYSYSEFGDIDGYLTQIGSNALPPDELYPYYRFPAEIRLDSQRFDPEGYNFELRSGMSLNASIKLRKRRVVTFFTDLFVRKADSVRSGS
ncbi:MAG: HlyD family efflux transporter periplasmic adaptor subunit [Cyanobacteria bacterium P01_A01_bin.105]